MLFKVLGIVIMLSAGLIAFLSLQNSDMSSPQLTFLQEPCKQLTPAQQLNKLINDDFNNLYREGKLPQNWNSIATVEYKINSTLAKALLGKNRPSIQRVANGKTYLELEIIDLPDEENPGIIIQSSLFDNKSKNKLFELGRTYRMSDLNGN